MTLNSLSCSTLVRCENNLRLLTLFFDPLFQLVLLQGQKCIWRKRMVWIALQNSYDVKAHSCCDHFTVTTNRQGERGIFDLFIEQVSLGTAVMILSRIQADSAARLNADRKVWSLYP